METTSPQPIKPLLELLDRCPPFLCYYGAHFQRAARPTVPEFVKLSGMSQGTFSRIVRKTTWAKVRLENVDAFSRACGVDLLNPEPFLQWFAKESQKGMPGIKTGNRNYPLMLQKLNILAGRAVLGKATPSPRP